MATYIPQITDYIPQIQPFVPDYNFYSQSLDFRQGKHDAARQQLSNVYGSLLNAPLTREDNNAARDKFFKTIDQDIQKMAGMDMSKAQNSQAAAGIFNQLVENKSIVKDMVWTKNFQSESRRAEGFKNCVDPAKCGGGWWEGGERHLQYQQMDFANASAQDAMNMANANYVPYQDVTKQAMAIAKEAGLSITEDQITGNWITTTKNGPKLVGPLQELLMGTLGKDPKMQEYYQAKANVDRRDWVQGNAQQYGSINGAEQMYIQQMSSSIEMMYAPLERALEDNVESVTAKQEKLAEGMKTLPPDRRSRMEAMYDEFAGVNEAYSSSLEEVKNVNGEIQVGKRNNTYSLDQIDRMMASYELGTDINRSAEVLAYKDYSFSAKANPYGVEAASFRNRMLMEEFQHRNARDLATHKHELDMYANQLLAMGGAEHNIPTTVTDIAGSTSVGELNRQATANQNRGFDAFGKDRNGLKADISGNEKAIVDQVALRVRKAAESGDRQAKEDFVAIAENYLVAQESTDDVIAQRSGHVGEPAVNTTAAASREKLLDQLENATTTQQKYDILKRVPINTQDLQGTQADHLYNNTVKGMLDQGPDSKGNEVLRDYLTVTQMQTTDLRRNIAAKNKSLEMMDEWYATEAKDVVLGANTKEKYGPQWADAFDAYIDDKGHAVSKAKFVENMAIKGYDQATAEEMYRGDSRLGWNEDLDPEGRGTYDGFTGTYNVLASGIDAVGTTLSGVTELIGDALGYLPATAMGIEVDWFDRGWDYDSPNDVANWGGHVADPLDWRNDDQALKNPGLHDMWRRAFSEFATPDGDRAWMGITGAGDASSMGQRYDMVDPAKYRSTPTLGATGYIKDALNDGTAVFTMGDFSTEVPETSEQAKNLMNTIYRDFLTQKTGNSRPMATVTYSDIAGGDPNKVGMNIKLNDSYVKKYRGSAKNAGIMRDLDLTGQGITMYMDRKNTNNIFTAGAQESSLEKTMKWTGKLDFDAYPNYAPDFKIEADKTTGQYVASGMIKTGMDEQGQPIMEYYTATHAFNEDLNLLVAQYDDFLAQKVAAPNMALEQQWAYQNK